MFYAGIGILTAVCIVYISVKVWLIRQKKRLKQQWTEDLTDLPEEGGMTNEKK